jgi:DNA repair protein RecN (Recombination protein N)
MLTDLRIRNLAIIEDLEIVFEPGFNVITGETGAGKTILMRALGLLLGDRGGADLIREGAHEAEIEALFTGPAVGAALAAAACRAPPIDDAAAAGEAPPTGDAAAAWEVPPTESVSTAPEALAPGDTAAARDDDTDPGAESDELTIRRAIAAGRQRAYVNDRLVTTGRLTALGEHLVHVYGQHEHHTLLKPESQRDILDAAGGLAALAATMRARYRDLVDLERRLCLVREGAASLAARRELLAYQVQELARVALLPGEAAELEREREWLRHAERLHAAAAEAERTLYAGDAAVLDTLARLASRLAGLASIDPELGEAARLLDEARPALEEAALRLGTRARAIAADPERLERVEERLAVIQRLARKHGCSADELVERRAAAERELAELEGGTDPAEIERRVASATATAWQAADALSAARRTAARALAKRITAGLRELALAGAEITIDLEPLAASPATSPARRRGEQTLSPAGAERVVFLFAPNRGEPPRSLARIASGGELSRVMLALKAATAGASEVPTLLFDEVDAGIGGGVAEVVGRKLAQLARGRQVICITHLPQIAACADHHFVVRRRPARGRTRSSAERLSDAERVEELARMLGGVTITAQARRHAAELHRLGRHGVEG